MKKRVPMITTCLIGAGLLAVGTFVSVEPKAFAAEQAALNQASANRKVQDAEQQLWKSTSADRPDAEEIETKVRQVEKLRADQRLAFIRSVSEAAKVLAEEQTTILLGTAASVMPEAPPRLGTNPL